MSGEKSAAKTKAEQLKWRKQMYELWHEWLQLSDEKDWDDYVRDEYREAKAVSFDVWWDKYWKRTLMGREDYAFMPVNTVEEFNESIEVQRAFGELNERIYIIGFSAPKHVLRKALEKLIEEFHTTNLKTGHQFEDYSMTRVALVKPPTKRFVTTVRTILDIYKEWLNSPEKKLYEIGFDVGLNKEKGGQFDDKKQLMSITVSRYVKWGHEITAQLTVGEFPYYNMPK